MLLDFESSQRRARERLDRSSPRRRRSDAGRPRLPQVALAEVRAAALGPGRPSMAALQRRVAAACQAAGHKTPSRAALYAAFHHVQGHTYPIAALPPHVGVALYNLDPAGIVSGRQLAFYCFNYGSTHAIMFAAALPWLDLYQASRLRGWRPRSRGLLQAVLRVRGSQ